MKSILKEFKLQKELFWTKQKYKHKNNNKKALPEPGIEPGNSCTASWRVTTGPPRQRNLWLKIRC